MPARTWCRRRQRLPPKGRPVSPRAAACHLAPAAVTWIFGCATAVAVFVAYGEWAACCCPASRARWAPALACGPVLMASAAAKVFSCSSLRQAPLRQPFALIWARPAGIGANDVANAFGSSVGERSWRPGRVQAHATCKNAQRSCPACACFAFFSSSHPHFTRLPSSTAFDHQVPRR